MVAPSGPAAPITVLLVDDQPLVGAAIGRLLAAEPDIELRCCHESSSAVALANQMKPTVILQDLVMPGIDGLTLVLQFRANAATADTPVIVLSGNDDRETRARAVAAGASDYLVKLPAKGELIACLRRHGTAPRTSHESESPDEAASADVDVTLDPVVAAPFLQAGGGNPAVVLTFIDQFIAEAATRIASLNDAAQRQDAATLKATAHALRGASAIMGASRLAALCATLEKDLECLPAGASSPALDAFDEEFVRVRAAFDTERRRIVSGHRR